VYPVTLTRIHNQQAFTLVSGKIYFFTFHQRRHLEVVQGTLHPGLMSERNFQK
jgi:hypothetical protein